MARPNPLAQPEFAQDVAEALAAGMSRQEMCDLFGVSDRDTITRWKKDARVKARLTALINERVQEVVRKVDGKVAAALQRDDLTVQELLAIRKEFLGGALRAQVEKADEETIGEAAEFMDKNPDLAQEFIAAMERATAEAS